MKRRVVFFVANVFPFSNPFLRMQALALRRYEAFILGIRKLRNPGFPEERIYTLLGENQRSYFRELRWYLLGQAPDVLDVLREWRPDLVHAHFGPNATTVLPLVRKLNIPLVVTFHGYDATARRPLFLRHTIYFARRKALMRYAQTFLVVSHFLKRKLLEQGYPEDRIVVHPWGLDVSRFPEPLPWEKRDPVILSVGRLVPVKGFHLVVQAMKRLNVMRPVTWRILGEGPQRRALEKAARQAGIRAEFLGARPHEEVLETMRHALLLVGPSVPQKTGEEEGFGMVFLEAMAQGTPVVATQSGGIPEVVVHGKTGWLVPPGDVQRLRDAMEQMLNDPDLWTTMSRYAREHVKKRYTLDRHVSVLEEVYDRVIDGACGG